ncbi:MAG: sigma-70 family RNA polymerase sigma factor [Pedobacter sp.]|uniref:RNA polymerase sigma factor n=1 Tax=Pedobacter sp. JCM 36344 TaxID=3374280 RepID=UPI0019BC44F7|nr:sigma-70 family RNA polymerase sigma factor [Pedobacter sp.]
MSNKLSSSVPTDREVVLGILNNSDDALNKLYVGYFPMILQFILNNNGDEDDAKDVYQEGIIVLYNKVKSGDFELSSKLKTYIYSVCRRIWLKKLAQQRKKTNNVSDFEDIIATDVDIDDHEQKEEQFDKMQSALLHLGEPCKTIIQDFYLNNLSMHDISEKFGYTNTDNAKTQKYKCLQRLKKLFFQS